MKFASLIVATMLASPVAGLAQLTSTGPFVGNYSESFESFPNYGSGGIYDTLSVFGGEGTFSSYPGGTNQLYIVSPTNGASWGLGGNGLLNNVADGVNALGLEGFGNPNSAWKPEDVILTFAKPVTSFGGYFATDSTNNHFYLNFYDTSGHLMTYQDIYQTGSTMNWYGWNSTTPIGSIEFTDNYAPVMDGLQINAVPEPASIAALGIGLVGLVSRRRRSN